DLLQGRQDRRAHDREYAGDGRDARQDRDRYAGQGSVLYRVFIHSPLRGDLARRTLGLAQKRYGRPWREALRRRQLDTARLSGREQGRAVHRRGERPYLQQPVDAGRPRTTDLD